MNSTPIAICGDLHARGSDLQAFYRQWDAACNTMASANARLVLVAGDVFQSPTIGDASANPDDVIAAVKQPIRTHLSETQLVFIPGNHDMPADSPNTLESIAGGNVEIVRSPQFGLRGGIEVMCLPWSWDLSGGSAEEQTERLCDRPRSHDSPRILLAHANSVGAQMNNGKVCDSGNWCLSRAFLENLDVDRVAVGHFHRRNADFAGRGRGGPLGALRQTDHGGEGDAQGFELWYPEEYRADWVELSECKPHRTVIVMDGDPIPDPANNLKIKTDGWVMGAAQAQRFHEAGGKVESIRVKEERISRMEIKPDEARDPVALFKKWAATQTDIGAPISDCLAELEDELKKNPLDVEPDAVEADVSGKEVQ